MSQSSEPFDPYYQWLGIPPDEQPPNHYRLLGIQLFEENREVITHAADRQMVHLRSFQNGPRAAQSQRLLNEVATAKVCLLSQDRKAAYDAELRQLVLVAAPSVVPPLAAPPAEDLEAGIRFGGTPGTLTAAPSFRATRLARPRRRLGLLPWLIMLILALVGGMAFWAWWSDQHATQRLILRWPEAQRERASLALDGRPVDLASEVVATGEQLELTLRPGRYELQIERPGFEPIRESIEVDLDEPTWLEVSMAATQSSGVASRKEEETPPAIGYLVLQWPIATRNGASLQIDGKVIELNRRPFSDNPDAVQVRLKAGSHNLVAVLPDGQTVEHAFDLEPAAQRELTVATTPVRLVLEWPTADREGATVEIDGHRRNLTADPISVDDNQVVYEVQPGQHAVRISRPGFDDFRTPPTDLQAEATFPVTWVKAAKPRPAPEELQRLRDEFRKEYEQFEQHAKWSAEQDSTRQSELLRFLLARLELEIEKLPAQSDRQWAACEETLQLALKGDEFVLAHNLLTGALGSDLFSASERQTWEERIWVAALKSQKVDNLADYLRLRKTDGRVPTDAEQAVIARRLSEAVDPSGDIDQIDARIRELQNETLLSRPAALQAQVALYKRAAEVELIDPASALDLCEKMLNAVPQVFESGLDDAGRQVDTLVDTILSVVRRKSIREARNAEPLRTRLARIDEGIKVVRELETLFPRVQAARETIAQGTATGADQKFVGLWLLQLGLYPESLPYLQNAEDESLARLGQPLPQTGRELVALAELADEEAHKSKYSRRQQEALRAFAQFLRKTALDKNDDTLQPLEKIQLRRMLGTLGLDRDPAEAEQQKAKRKKTKS